MICFLEKGSDLTQDYFQAHLVVSALDLATKVLIYLSLHHEFTRLSSGEASV